MNRKLNYALRSAAILAAATALSCVTSTPVHADTVRQFRDLRVAGWFSAYKATSSKGEVRFEKDSYVVSARVYIDCQAAGQFHAFLRHHSRELYGGSGPWRDTNEVTCTDSATAEGWVAGRNFLHPRYGKSAVIQLCVSHRLGTGCSNEVEVLDPVLDPAISTGPAAD
ncbi:hypothetical protein ACFT5C_33025 [Streptomyces sp. NPDC057116]|uniref:hypothetical protein n=1 Tax=Streptomyces sp. NPDC057116 TaxID=3346023 RepID=UPI003643927E